MHKDRYASLIRFPFFGSFKGHIVECTLYLHCQYFHSKPKKLCQDKMGLQAFVLSEDEPAHLFNRIKAFILRLLYKGFKGQRRV